MKEKALALARSHWLLLLILGLLTVSFTYGWFFDDSKPISGGGWADQSTHHRYVEALFEAELPSKGSLHYAAGYPILGVFGKIFLYDHPFAVVSWTLLMASAAFIYLASVKSLGKRWTLLFMAALFYWEGHTRTLNYASEVFHVPWNNQVLFFLMAFYFWLFATRLSENPPTKLLAVVGLIGGLSFVTREETIIFVAPVTAIYLWLTKATLKQWFITYAIVGIMYLPQLLIKYAVLGSVTSTGRRKGYAQLAGSYFQGEFFVRNFWETLINPDHFTQQKANRKALLEAAPWLWAAPAGIALILWRKGYSLGVKIFAGLSLAILCFYLSGENMSAQKLRFHCLRYISSSLILLNFAAVVFAKELVDFGRVKLIPEPATKPASKRK